MNDSGANCNDKIGDSVLTNLDLVHYPSGRAELHSSFIVCPGGGYWRHAEHEGEPIARWLNSLGITAFVLRYRLTPDRHPAPLDDLQTAIRRVRASASEYNLDPSKLGVIGFSAGGHLVGTAATRFDLGDPAADDPVQRESSRPDVIVLVYPVISFTEFTHEGTVSNLLGDDADLDLRLSLSNQYQVSPETPPAFLWHTADDQTVPVENSLLFATALSKSEVPFELHVFPKGAHGAGLAEDNPVLSQWTTLCAVWLKGQGF